VAGHGEGVTSADAGAGFIFATDRSSQMLDVIDAASHKLVASTKSDAQRVHRDRRWS